MDDLQLVAPLWWRVHCPELTRGNDRDTPAPSAREAACQWAQLLGDRDGLVVEVRQITARRGDVHRFALGSEVKWTATLLVTEVTGG